MVVGFLPQCMSNLHRLHASAEMGELRRLVGWIGDGSVGASLEKLLLPGLEPLEPPPTYNEAELLGLEVESDKESEERQAL